jgi:hypothetical protein
MLVPTIEAESSLDLGVFSGYRSDQWHADCCGLIGTLQSSVRSRSLAIYTMLGHMKLGSRFRWEKGPRISLHLMHQFQE